MHVYGAMLIAKQENDVLSQGLKAAASSFSLYLLLPALGWWLGAGGNDFFSPELAGSFLAEPVRLLYLVCAVGLVVATALLSARLPAAQHTYLVKPGAVHWRHIALEMILTLGPYSDHRAMLVWEPSAALRWAGIILFGFGMGLALWSGFLRSRQAGLQDLAPYDPVLLVDGPYRRLRHPHYLGLILYALGAALIFRSWFGLGAALFLFNFVIMRMNQDEQKASKKYGIRWTAYAHHSWRLLPYIF